MKYIVHEPKYHPGQFFNQKQLRYHQKIYAEECEKLEQIEFMYDVLIIVESLNNVWSV